MHKLYSIEPQDLAAALASCVLVVSCSGRGVRTLTAKQVLAARTPDRPILPVIDLALSRDVDPLLAGVALVDLIDFDEIEGGHCGELVFGSVQEPGETVDITGMSEGMFCQ